MGDVEPGGHQDREGGEGPGSQVETTWEGIEPPEGVEPPDLSPCPPEIPGFYCSECGKSYLWNCLPFTSHRSPGGSEVYSARACDACGKSVVSVEEIWSNLGGIDITTCLCPGCGASHFCGRGFCFRCGRDMSGS